MALLYYQPRLFLRQVPNALLERYFAQRNLLTDIPWRNLRETEIDVIYSAITNLPDAIRREIAGDFRSISALASGKTAPWLIKVGKEHGIDLVSDFSGRRSAYERSAFTFLEHRDVFEEARAVVRWAALPQRSMELRTGLPALIPDVSQSVLGRLAAALGAYYQREQGRGEHCVVEHVLRSGRVDFFFAYPADYLDTLIGYEQDGSFARKTWRPAFEVVIAYDRVAGTLELFAQGPREVRDDIARIFAREVLEAEEPSAPVSGPAYDLQVLKNPNFEFATSTVDQVLSVRLLSLRVQDSLGDRLIFEPAPKDPRRSVHDLIERALNQTRMPLENLRVTQASIEACFSRGTKRPKRVVATITAPSHCTLKDSEEERTLAHLLGEWKIARLS